VLRATAPRHARGTGPAPDSGSLLVFLRAVEQRTGPSVRLEAIFDRPLDRLGDRVVAWLRAHPRYRAYPTENAEEFARSAEAWPNRWERSALRPDSFEQLRSYESDGKGRPLRRVAEPNPTRSGRGSGAPARPSTDK